MKGLADNKKELHEPEPFKLEPLHLQDLTYPTYACAVVKSVGQLDVLNGCTDEESSTRYVFILYENAIRWKDGAKVDQTG